MENSSNTKSETLCKVCGDKASGKHYGVSSCDGCRGFFKRSIRRNLEYICKENGRCIVDVTRRNQCQACRFKKCLQVNMKRDAVQHERAPRAPQANFHYPLTLGSRLQGLSNSSIFANVPFQLQGPSFLEPVPSFLTANPQAQYLHQHFISPSLLNSFHRHPGAIISNSVGMPPVYTLKYPTINDGGRSSSSSKDDSSDEQNLEKPSEDRCKLEIPVIHDSFRTNMRPSFDVSSMALLPAENVYESAAKLLFLAIKWARTIPSFLQLSYRDQSILLEDSWSELFVLTASQWALPIDETVLISNAVAPNSRHSALEEDARKLREVITRLTILRLDHTEHACLKALVLFKSECRGLCEPNHVELLQDQTHVMLHEYCTQRQSTCKGRFGKLLLTLPSIQSITKRGLEELLFRQTVGDVAIEKLLTDLSKCSHPH